MEWKPKRGEPGYWNTKLGSAKSEEDFLEAYQEHKKELEEHGSKLHPFNVLTTRLLAKFGQYQYGDDILDPQREDAIWILEEMQRYLVLEENKYGRFTGFHSAARKALSSIAADIACVRASLKGYERSSKEEFTENKNP